MKLGIKIFLCSFILFEVVFNISGWIMIEHGFNTNLQADIQSGLNEQETIKSGLEVTGKVLVEKYENNYFKSYLCSYFQNYFNYYNKGSVYAEIREYDNKLVYSNFLMKDFGDREELDAVVDGNKKYVIRDIDGKSYLFITSLFQAGDDRYKYTYIKNITSVYDCRSSEYDLFFLLNIIVPICLAACLYLTLKVMTKPIENLTECAQVIGSGDYSKRVDIISNDEIGELSRTFNNMADSISEKVNELNKNAREKEEFIQGLSHEIKTPLTAILGYAEFLRDAKYNEENTIKGMNYIYNEAKRLENISFRLMELILLENRELHLKNENMKKVLEEVYTLFEKQLEEKRLVLNLKINDIEAKVEKELYKLVVTNLVHNAIKASYDGSTINIETIEGSNGEFILSVEDYGIGIAKDEIDKIFEPFYMVDKSRTRANNGAGLGLAICLKIIKFHKGEIKVKSKFREGTKVSVIIPGIYNIDTSY